MTARCKSRNPHFKIKPVGKIEEKDDYLSLVFEIKSCPKSMAILEAAKSKRPIYSGRGRPKN